jgi:hypothetical protein
VQQGGARFWCAVVATPGVLQALACSAPALRGKVSWHATTLLVVSCDTNGRKLGRHTVNPLPCSAVLLSQVDQDPVLSRFVDHMLRDYFATEMPPPPADDPSNWSDAAQVRGKGAAAGMKTDRGVTWVLDTDS